MKWFELSKKTSFYALFLQTCIKLARNCHWYFCFFCLSSILSKSRKFGQSWFRRSQTPFELSTQSKFEKNQLCLLYLYHHAISDILQKIMKTKAFGIFFRRNCKSVSLPCLRRSEVLRSLKHYPRALEKFLKFASHPRGEGGGVEGHYCLNQDPNLWPSFQTHVSCFNRSVMPPVQKLYETVFSFATSVNKGAGFERWPVLQGVREHHQGAAGRRVLVLPTLQRQSQAGHQAQSKARAQEESSLATRCWD